MPRAVADEEDAVLHAVAQAVREPVALVAHGVRAEALGERDGRLLDMAARVVGADADARLRPGRHAPAVAPAHDAPLDPEPSCSGWTSRPRESGASGGW